MLSEKYYEIKLLTITKCNPRQFSICICNMYAGLWLQGRCLLGEEECEERDDLRLTWMRITVCPLTKRLSIAHLRAIWLLLSLSIATAINPFPATLFSGKDLGIHISLNQQFSILETNNRTFKTFNGLISLLVSYQKLMRTFWSTFNFLYKKLRNAICISKFYGNGNFSLFFDYLFPSL